MRRPSGDHEAWVTVVRGPPASTRCSLAVPAATWNTSRARGSTSRPLASAGGRVTIVCDRTVASGSASQRVSAIASAPMTAPIVCRPILGLPLARRRRERLQVVDHVPAVLDAQLVREALHRGFRHPVAQPVVELPLGMPLGHVDAEVRRARHHRARQRPIAAPLDAVTNGALLAVDLLAA